MKKIRTFVGVELPPDIRQRATELVKKLQATEATVRWVESHNLHLTLKFLGDVAMDESAEICDVVQAAVEELPPFDIELFGAGAFPTGDRPRTVWLGVGQGTEQMVELHDQVEQSLLPLGFRKEGRRFRPHITLGRVRHSPEQIAELGQLLQAFTEFSGGIMQVNEVTVFSCQLERTGPTYEPLGHVELNG